MQGLEDAIASYQGSAQADIADWKVEDARERYHVKIADRGQAREVIDALYVPGSSPRRTQAAADWLTSRVERRGPVRMSIGMRRFVVLKQLHANPAGNDSPENGVEAG